MNEVINSVSYGRYIFEGRPYFAVTYIIGLLYEIGGEQSTLVHIEATNSGFRAIFENDFYLYFPLTEDAEIIYKPIPEEEDGDKT